MDKIEKFLKSLGKKEREVFLLLMMQLEKDYTKVPGLLKLKGSKSSFRVRLGQYRLIFEKKNNKIIIVRITRRDDQTYKNL